MKRILMMAVVCFCITSCNNSNSPDSSKADSIQSVPGKPGVSYGAEGTDTGRSSMTNSTTTGSSGVMKQDSTSHDSSGAR